MCACLPFVPERTTDTLPECLPAWRVFSFSVGDACMAEQFTHVAGENGHMVVCNALDVGAPQKYSDRVVPWCTYTFPEIAHVGRYARDLDPEDLRTFTLQLNHFDRCITDDYDGQAGGRVGFVRIHVRKADDTILGSFVRCSSSGRWFALCVCVCVCFLPVAGGDPAGLSWRCKGDDDVAFAPLCPS